MVLWQNVTPATDKALLQHSMLQTLSGPSKWDLHDIQDLLVSKDMGSLGLKNHDALVWGSICDRKSHAPDLVATRPRHKEDRFSKWATERLTKWLFRCGCARFKKPSRIHGVAGYKDSTILQITFWVATLVASLIPVTSITILYYVHSMNKRLAVIAAFCVIISMSLSIFTTATRSEVFTATAAYGLLRLLS
jgi:hypothetical protein